MSSPFLREFNRARIGTSARGAAGHQLHGQRSLGAHLGPGQRDDRERQYISPLQTRYLPCAPDHFIVDQLRIWKARVGNSDEWDVQRLIGDREPTGAAFIAFFAASATSMTPPWISTGKGAGGARGRKTTRPFGI